jgi:hypothetical protein
MSASLKVTLTEAEEALIFGNGREAVDTLHEMKVIVKPTTTRYNPKMILKGYVNAGKIHSVQFDTEPVYTATEPRKVNPNPKPKTPKKMSEAVHATNGRAADAAEVIAQLGKLINTQVDMDMIRAEIQAAISEIPTNKIEVKVNQLPKVTMDRQHKQFETVLNLMVNRQNIWLRGPAGSGKSTLPRNAAKAMKLPFYEISVCAQTPESKLLGYMDATGNYVSTLFHKAYSEGGVFLLDEIDNGNPNVLAVLNSALANGSCAFPNGMVDKHKDFVLVAAANTIGTGGNLQYIGRNRIDAATIDRFWMVDVEYDEQLELDIAPVKKFTLRVQELRKRAVEMKLPVVISPRISINGGKMILAGMMEGNVLDLLLMNKLSDAERKTLGY